MELARDQIKQLESDIKETERRISDIKGSIHGKLDEEIIKNKFESIKNQQNLLKDQQTQLDAVTEPWKRKIMTLIEPTKIFIVHQGYYPEELQELYHCDSQWKAKELVDLLDLLEPKHRHGYSQVENKDRFKSA